MSAYGLNLFNNIKGHIVKCKLSPTSTHLQRDFFKETTVIVANIFILEIFYSHRRILMSVCICVYAHLSIYSLFLFVSESREERADQLKIIQRKLIYHRINYKHSSYRELQGIIQEQHKASSHRAGITPGVKGQRRGRDSRAQKYSVTQAEWGDVTVVSRT